MISNKRSHARDLLLYLFRKLAFDLVEPEPAFFVAHLLYHVEADPANVVDADLIECAFDERALDGVVELVAVDICRGVHGGYDGNLSE